MPTDAAATCGGFVTDDDTKPNRRLAERLQAQGLQLNQTGTLLSDGGANMRDLPWYRSQLAEHQRDWFHVTMHITVLRQHLKARVARAPRADLAQLDAQFERSTWYLFMPFVSNPQASAVRIMSPCSWPQLRSFGPMSAPGPTVCSGTACVFFCSTAQVMHRRSNWGLTLTLRQTLHSRYRRLGMSVRASGQTIRPENSPLLSTRHRSTRHRRAERPHYSRGNTA